MANYILRHLGGIVLFSVIFYVAVNTEKFWGSMRRRGFHCTDSSIKQPLLEDTISRSSLNTLGMGVPMAVVIVSECFSLLCVSQSTNKFSQLTSRLYANLIPFLYGLATERFVKNIGKFSVARLRPFFYTACQPESMGSYGCIYASDTTYIEHYVCTTINVSNTVFQSFPSGHSSMAFYGLVFTVIYLQRFSKGCLKNLTSVGLVVPLLQMLCIMLAVTVAVTRVLDYKHFWSDVIAGALLGITVAVVTSWYRMKFMEFEEMNKHEVQLQGDLNLVKETASDCNKTLNRSCSTQVGGDRKMECV